MKREPEERERREPEQGPQGDWSGQHQMPAEMPETDRQMPAGSGSLVEPAPRAGVTGMAVDEDPLHSHDSEGGVCVHVCVREGPLWLQEAYWP